MMASRRRTGGLDCRSHYLPTGVVDGESERERRSHPHEVGREAEVFGGEGDGLRFATSHERDK